MIFAHSGVSNKRWEVVQARGIRDKARPDFRRMERFQLQEGLPLLREQNRIENWKDIEVQGQQSLNLHKPTASLQQSWTELASGTVGARHNGDQDEIILASETVRPENRPYFRSDDVDREIDEFHELTDCREFPATRDHSFIGDSGETGRFSNRKIDVEQINFNPLNFCRYRGSAICRRTKPPASSRSIIARLLVGTSSRAMIKQEETGVELPTTDVGRRGSSSIQLTIADTPRLHAF